MQSLASQDPDAADRGICPTVAAFAGALAEGMRDVAARELLVELRPQLRATGRPSWQHADRHRSYLALDWLVRRNAPTWLRAARAPRTARTLERLPPLRDTATAAAAMSVLIGAGQMLADVHEIAAAHAQQRNGDQRAWDLGAIVGMSATSASGAAAAWEAADVAAPLSAGAVARVAWEIADQASEVVAGTAASDSVRTSAAVSTNATIADASRAALARPIAQLQHEARDLLLTMARVPARR